MHLRNLLRKREKLGAQEPPAIPPEDPENVTPQFTIIRSDTNTQEIISPPTFSTIDTEESPTTAKAGGGLQVSGLFKKRASSASRASVSSRSSRNSCRSPPRTPNSKDLSERLHIRRSVSSSHVPDNLPDIKFTEDPCSNGAEWEERATILAAENERQRSRPTSPAGVAAGIERQYGAIGLGVSAPTSNEQAPFSSQSGDDNVQEAIRLHEAGDLETSTQMFGRLADPDGENNTLSQVLYGLALRHGWGCPPNPTEAVTYLSAAASNAASIEKLALHAGKKKGGAAKGELVLAIFELANCFRHGWGVDKDPIAAQRYYETAANLGDADAMNEVAWCYGAGFGCKKDKFASARYYRLAEGVGSKTLGNTWIWKDKYNHVDGKGSKKSSTC